MADTPETLPATLPNPVGQAQQAHLVNILRRAARAEILPRFRRLNPEDISAKTHRADLVTEADTAAEAMITRALKIAFPDALVVGEEATAKDPSLPGQIADAPLAFLIDPVDGTWNFAHDLPVFGTILAVTQFGRPVMGLIYDPIADDWAIADDEGPARLENAQRSTSLKAAMGKQIEELIGFVPLPLIAKEHQRAMAAALPSFANTAPLRCSAHEYRLIARGQADFLISGAHMNAWDHAAGALICERAGCHVEMLDGGPYMASRTEGYLLVAPDRTTWNRIKKVFGFLLA